MSDLIEKLTLLIGTMEIAIARYPDATDNVEAKHITDLFRLCRDRIELLEQVEKNLTELHNVALAEIARLKDIARCYEELRSIIDGGSESMTHEDAVEALKASLAELADERECRKEADKAVNRYYDLCQILKAALAEAQNNDCITMGYLSEIRNALGFDGDFPALVEHCKSLKAQPAQSEPAAWDKFKAKADEVFGWVVGLGGYEDAVKSLYLLHTTQQPAQSEPVAYIDESIRIKWFIDHDKASKLIGTKLYATPQPSAEVERDAARYRWLLDQIYIDDELRLRIANVYVLKDESLDSAIAEAMKNGGAA